MGHADATTSMEDDYLPPVSLIDIIGIALGGVQQGGVVEMALALGNEALELLPLSAADEPALQRDPEVVKAVQVKAEALEKLHEAYDDYWQAKEDASDEFTAFARATSRVIALMAKKRKAIQVKRAQARQKEQAASTAKQGNASNKSASSSSSADDPNLRDADVLGYAVGQQLASLKTWVATASTSSSAPSPTPSYSPNVASIVAIIKSTNKDSDEVRELFEVWRQAEELHTPALCAPRDLGRALATGQDKLSVAETALLGEDHGFDFFSRGDNCSVCHQNLAGMELADKRLHARRCRANATVADLEEDYAQLLMARGCPMAGCEWMPTPSITEAKKLKTAFYNHWYVKHSDIRGPKCGYELPGSGGPCQFEVEGDGKDADKLETAIMVAHRELKHAVPAAAVDSVFWDGKEKTWIVGYARAQLHCAAKLSPPGSCLADLIAAGDNVPSNKHCFICFFDETLAPTSRSREMENSSHLDHVYRAHLDNTTGEYGVEDETHRCPCCGEDLPTTIFVQHLHAQGHPPLLPGYSPVGTVPVLDSLRPSGTAGGLRRLVSDYTAWAKEAEARRVDGQRGSGEGLGVVGEGSSRGGDALTVRSMRAGGWTTDTRRRPHFTPHSSLTKMTQQWHPQTTSRRLPSLPSSTSSSAQSRAARRQPSPTKPRTSSTIGERSRGKTLGRVRR